MSDEIVLPEVKQESSISLQIKAEIDVAVATAKQFPRSLTESINMALSLATMDEETAASCSYGLPRGGKIIVGASVRLAEIICGSYGNIRAGARIVEENERFIVAQGMCHDLQTNNLQTTDVTVRITNRQGVKYNDDMIITTMNAALAKARRNAIFQVVPKVLVEKIRRKAVEVAKGTEATLPTRRTAVVALLKKLGVKESQICTVVNVKKIDDIGIDECFMLKSIIISIENKETTVDEVFNKPAPEDLKKGVDESRGL